MTMIGQWISLLAALLILFAYAAHQLGRMERTSLACLLLNLCGSATLTFFAIRARELGLSVMEGAWAAISLSALVVRGRRGA
jgi:hypothetical protein